jgi:signal transduction histidine kinase
MTRLWPRSLLGQVLLAVALALLVAQAISAVLLYRASEQRREEALLHAVAFRLVAAPAPGAATDAPGHDFERHARRALRQRFGAIPRSLRIERTDRSPLLAGEQREPALEAALRAIVADQQTPVEELVVIRRRAADDSYLRSGAQRPRGADWQGRALLVAGLRRAGESQWLVARALAPRAEPGALSSLVEQTLVLYLVLVGILALLLRRITRPLAALTARVDRFARTPEIEGQLAPEGPDDVRHLIAAHNRMEARIAGMLDEKDVMLGAIGHDLKTPLAALRVRIESVEDDAERTRMAATIEDIVRSLDDILSLARVGRASEPPERTELSALTASVVEEFEDMGEPVALGDTQRLVAPVHVTWLKRGLRNLISNAVRYGGGAEVTLARTSDEAVLCVVDRGPGIPADRIEAMLEPFTRGEASRNRDTGGAGLGLTLARAIAEQHGGRLVLANRPGGGLAAELRLPLE